MRTTAIIAVAVAMLSGPLVAQETKPVPKDSARVFVPGCTKGFIFTAGHRTQDEPGSAEIPEGMHLRMNGPKKVMAEIKAHEGSMIEITGLVKKGQYKTGRCRHRWWRPCWARSGAWCQRGGQPRRQPDHDRRRGVAPGRG